MIAQFGYRLGSDRLVRTFSGRLYREGDIAAMIHRFNKTHPGPIGQEIPMTTEAQVKSLKEAPEIPGVPKFDHIPAIGPRNDYVLVIKHKDEETKGGIVIPDSAKEPSRKATILKVGPGRILKDGSRHPMDLEPGDIVMVLMYAGSDFKLGDVEFVLMEESDIICTIDPHELSR